MIVTGERAVTDDQYQIIEVTNDIKIRYDMTKAIIKNLNDLRVDPDGVPSNDAFDNASRFIRQLYREPGTEEFPAPRLILAIGHGIDMRWKYGTNLVCMHFPESGANPTYCYIKTPDHSDTIKHISPEDMVDLLGEFI